jgi:REP element-mobilizing transposase RayT
VKQLSFPDRRVGRPRKKRPSLQHKKRPFLSGREPVLVTARVSPETRNLRRMAIYHAIRRALATSLARTGFRVVHLSIQRNHIHLLAEATDSHALSRGMQGLLISAARRINARLGRRGTVFADRFHERIIESPKQCRHALAYVLNNWRRHGQDRYRADWTLDPFSSGVNFGGWRELAGSSQLFGTPDWYERLPTSAPQTWLLRVGWERHGLIGANERPGPAADHVEIEAV